MEEISLTRKDRIFLYNQYEILKQLAVLAEEEDLAADYEIYQVIVANGYEHEYYMLAGVIDDNTSTRDMKFVWDVLDMYEAIYDSYRTLPVLQEKYQKHEIIFPGFDGNEEASLRAYSLFVVDKLERYSEVFEDGKRDLNTHTPRVGKYSRMLSTWLEMGMPKRMSEEQVNTLMRA